VVAAATAAVLAVVLTGCGSQSNPASAVRSTDASGGKASAPASRGLNTKQLKAALPNQFSVPADFDQSRTRKAWDNTDTTICQSERWPDAWCGEAIAFGLAGFTNLDDQELSIRLISFGDADTAARLFQGNGTPDEVGANPPGDQIDGFEIPETVQTDQVPPWLGKGISVRQGAVIAKVEYTWASGTTIPSDRLLSLTDMVVQRIQQTQAGKPPIASAR
jgi:hypothetical protein